MNHEQEQPVFADLPRAEALRRARDNARIRHEKRNALEAELDTSLALQSFWPEAFAAGGAKSHVVGAPASGFRYVVTRGDGVKREWPVAEVPVELWGRCVPDGLPSNHPLRRELARAQESER